jgi:GAF domain-containing protein
VKLKKEVVGLLVVVRKAPSPFNPSNKTLLEAVSDYASISLVNANLFRTIEERARSMQQAAEVALASDRKKEQVLLNFQNEISQKLANTTKSIEAMLIGEDARLNSAQKALLRAVLESLNGITKTVELIQAPE